MTEFVVGLNFLHSALCFQITSEFSSQLVLNSQLREDLEILRVGHDHFEQQHKDLEEVK